MSVVIRITWDFSDVAFGVNKVGAATAIPDPYVRGQSCSNASHQLHHVRITAGTTRYYVVLAGYQHCKQKLKAVHKGAVNWCFVKFWLFLQITKQARVVCAVLYFFMFWSFFCGTRWEIVCLENSYDSF